MDDDNQPPSKLKAALKEKLGQTKHLVQTQVQHLQAGQLRWSSSSDDDDDMDELETGEHKPGLADRFVYEPRNFPERLTAGTLLKSKLKTSECVRIHYRPWCKYLLIVFLVLFGALFTPALIPRWLGFTWATTDDLCQNRDQKLSALQARLENITDLPSLRAAYNRHLFEERCFDSAAAKFYNGLGQFRWPDECTVEKAGAAIETEVCVGPSSVSTCSKLSGFQKFLGGIAGACKTKTIPKSCKTVVDGSRAQAMLELQREEDAADAVNQVEEEAQPILNTANEQGKKVISTLMVQVDVASDIFIVYKIISLVIGMPLVIYKRERGSRILGATFGMQKITFVVLVVIALTVYEPLVALFKQTDLPRLFRNFRNDPCYVDVDFSQRRVELVLDACSEVSALAANSSVSIQRMDDTYYLTRRFALCHLPKRTHPRETLMNAVRDRFRDGDLKFKGTCNATLLDELTSTAPDDPDISKFRALMGSGVIAQLLLKIVISSFVVHLMSYFEPMIPHSGKVELWDTRHAAATPTDGSAGDARMVPLNKSEERSVVRFARDKNLLPLLFTSFFLVIEIMLIIYSIVVANTKLSDLTDDTVENGPSQAFRCLVT